MELNPTTVIMDYDDTPVMNTKREEGKPDVKQPLLLRHVVNLALNGRPEGTKPMTPEEKLRAFRICVRMYADDESAELEIEDLALLKKRVPLAYNTLIYGRICEIIEGPTLLGE